MVVDGAWSSSITGTGGSSGTPTWSRAPSPPTGRCCGRRPSTCRRAARPGARHRAGSGRDRLGDREHAAEHANVLVLGYNAASGALVRTIQYSSGGGIAEHGASIVADAAGNLYVGGGTAGRLRLPDAQVRRQRAARLEEDPGRRRLGPDLQEQARSRSMVSTRVSGRAFWAITSVMGPILRLAQRGRPCCPSRRLPRSPEKATDCSGRGWRSWFRDAEICRETG